MKLSLSNKNKTLYNYLIKYKKWAFLGSLFLLISVSLLIPMPLLTMHIIDDILPNGNLKLLTIICIIFIAVLLLNGISNNLQNYYFSKFNNKIIFDIQLDILKRIQKTSTQYRQKMQTGYLMSRFEDANKLYSLFAKTYINIFKDILTLIVGVSIIFNIHWKLAIVSLILLPFFIFSLKKFGTKIKLISAKLFEQDAQVTKRLQEAISLLDTFIAFNAEKYSTIKVIEKQKLYIRTSIKKSIIQNIASSIIAIISGIGPILVLWYGGSEIINNNLTLGELIAFNSFLGYVFGPTSRITNSFLNIQQSLAAWDRIYYILNNIPIRNSASSKSVINSIQGHICFNNVCLKYNDKLILNNINFEILPKQKIAIVGESGGGKSSLISLLALLNDYTSGLITVDGFNINNIANLKQQIAIVHQEPVLFTDTIKNNIKLGKFNASDEEVVLAAKKANIHEFIMQLPTKYDTIVDERGSNMSIGQKQRIAIARCVIRNPSIFIMDEPTSNLDAKSEKELFDLLFDFIKYRTTIIVAHRLSSIIFADKIIVLEKGEIVEIGTHKELLENNKRYAKLWYTQNSKN